MIVPEVIEPDTTKPYIDGPQLVRPYDTNLSYSIVGISGGKFVVNSSKVKIIESNENSCLLEITTGRAGDFILTYSKEDEEDITLNVTIKSF